MVVAAVMRALGCMVVDEEQANRRLIVPIKDVMGI